MTKSVAEKAKHHLEWGDVDELRSMAPEMAMEIGKLQRKIGGVIRYLDLLIAGCPDAEVSIDELRRVRILLLMGGGEQ